MILILILGQLGYMLYGQGDRYNNISASLPLSIHIYMQMHVK